MAFMIQERDNLIQEPSWKDQPLKMSLLGWKSSPEQLEGAWGWEDWATGLSGVEHGSQDTASLLGHSRPAFLTSRNTFKGGKVTAIRSTLPAAMSPELLTWDLFMNWAVVTRRFVITIKWNRGKNIYSKCRTMNGTSLVVPEVTYTVFCYI